MRESKNLQEEGSLTAFQRGSEANKIDEDQEEDVKFNVTNFNSGQSVRQNLPQNRQLESLGGDCTKHNTERIGSTRRCRPQEEVESQEI